MTTVYQSRSMQIAERELIKFRDNADIEIEKLKSIHVDLLTSAFMHNAGERTLVGDEAASMFPTETMVKIMQLADSADLDSLKSLCAEIKRVKKEAIASIAERRAEEDFENTTAESFLPD